MDGDLDLARPDGGRLRHRQGQDPVLEVGLDVLEVEVVWELEAAVVAGRFELAPARPPGNVDPGATLDGEDAVVDAEGEAVPADAR